MSLRASRTDGFSAFVLTSAWIAVALTLATLLAPGDASVEAAAAPAVERRSQTTIITVSAVDPCTSDPVGVEASLVLDIARQVGTDRSDVDVRLERAGAMTFQGAGAREGSIVPLTRSFTPYMTPISGVPYVHPLRAPLAAPHSTLELLVGLQGRTDDRGEVTFSVVSAQIDGRRSPCSRSPVDPPAQPIT
jgi:hypothetical protein